MSSFILIVGWLCIACICVALAAAAISVAAYLCAKALERFEWAIAAKTTHSCGLQLAAAAYWFSESKEAYEVLRTLSERLVKGYGIDESQWRDAWRKRLSTTTSGPTP